jgi:signal transduction histidine kinase
MKHTRLFLLLAFLLGLSIGVSAHKDFPQYSKEQPLVIVCDWDFRPFEFLDSEGHPAGYNVDVLDMIFDNLEIPHKFVMQEWHVATTMFERREADLIHALFFYYKGHPYVSTHKYINYYNLKAARLMDVPPLRQLHDLTREDTVLVKEDDYAALTLAVMGDTTFVTEYHSPKEGLTGIRHGQYKYYIWGEMPLMRKIKELGLDSIALDDVDIPAGELRIIGYDKDLVDIIDDQYTRLEQAGDLQKIYDRWFHPELEHNDTSPVALFVLAALVAVIIFVFLLIHFVTRRVRAAVRQRSDLGQMMNQVLNMGDYAVVEWDIQTNTLRNKYGHMMPFDSMNPEDFLKRMSAEEAAQLHSLNKQMLSGAISHFDMHLSLNHNTPENPVWKEYYGNAIIEKENGKPRYVVYTTKDITAEMAEEHHVQTLASKYKNIFDTNLVAMSLYDANGHLLEINKKMRELCQITSDNEQLFKSTSLFEFPNIKGIYLPGSKHVMHVCQHLFEPTLNLDKYIEFRIYPVFADDGVLVYYIVTNRDITAERDMYFELRNHDHQLHVTNETIKRYEQQLQYLLEESQMYIWYYSINDNLIKMTRSPGEVIYTQNLNEYVESITEASRTDAVNAIRKVLQQGLSYTTILLFDYTPIDPLPTWYSIYGVPIFDKDGKIKEYFGLARDITNLMKAQEQLRIETVRAEDSGRLKSAFLANMTHEIRTPLNAIVGFSGLLQMVDTEEERMEFIRIIRNNCDMLLRLINDILEASNMGQAITIKPEPVDLSLVFNDICQTLAQRVQEPGVEFLTDNPYDSYPAVLDKGRLQQLLTNFVTNAVKYTHQGHIKVGYFLQTRNERGKVTDDGTGRQGIYFYCEDTGAGIPSEKQDSVFERFVKLNDFVQGTGLGLSICKAIVEKAHGQIGVYSRGEGHGSTFWFWLPTP